MGFCVCSDFIWFNAVSVHKKLINLVSESQNTLSLAIYYNPRFNRGNAEIEVNWERNSFEFYKLMPTFY